MAITLNPIGVIHTPFHDPQKTPIQASRSDADGWIDLDPAYRDGLQDIAGFSHLYLIYSLHLTEEVRLLVEPFLDDQPRGIFSTRHPYRPNHLGLSIVRLISLEGTRLHIKDVDMLDGSPLFDIKPYFAEFDVRVNTHSGWYAQRAKP